MLSFKDLQGNTVRLAFEEMRFSLNPKHVWVICRYQNKWLVTNHRTRGLEFPGGKVEADESVTEAAYREVKEETGASVETLTFIGQYEVLFEQQSIVKNIYFASIKSLENQASYFETEGPMLLSELPTDIRTDKRFSFIMKDDVLTYSLEKLAEKQLV
ncbi:RNA deprotection pyrophosphohydrolase [Halalkalibacterium ligniniphilum]|uniref:RNA deprotection pyrophosphohydrolase n=1 Tax=Halalkalibacterium ligniniphilum TaxID=1134413 RepID=UPI0003469E2B|nr:nucleoside triphosphatase YtkD [Halalkalibacterium ligniniphilum]